MSAIHEILENEGRDIKVDDTATVKFDPNKKKFADAFHQVEINSFADLQALSFIPSGLDEKDTLKAIAADDEEALSIARNLFEKNQANCCSEPNESRPDVPLKRVFRRELRSIYNGVRKSQNKHLARVLSEQYRALVNWDDLEAAIVRGWIYNLPRLFGKTVHIALIKDLVVGKNSKFVIKKPTKAMFVRDIVTHIGGVIKIEPSYLKIKARSVRGNVP